MANDLESYLNLISADFREQPDFVAFLSNLLVLPVEQQAALLAMPPAFDLDVAIGAQLDVIGIWVGRARRLEAPLSDVYFSWDTQGLGWEEGVWFQENNPISGYIILDDDTYRLILRAKIAANSWDGTLAGIVKILTVLFGDPVTHQSATLMTDDGVIIQTEFGQQIIVDVTSGIGGPAGFGATRDDGFYITGNDGQPIVFTATAPPTRTLVFAQDNQDMSAVIAMSGKLPSTVIVSLFKQGYLGLRVAGVRLDYQVVSVDGVPMFGFDVENEYISGWDVGAWGVGL